MSSEQFIKTFVLPDGIHEQNLLKHIDETINVFGGLVEQSKIDGEWKYEVDSDKRFRVRDMLGTGMVFRVISDKYKNVSIVDGAGEWGG